MLVDTGTIAIACFLAITASTLSHFIEAAHSRSFHHQPPSRSRAWKRWVRNTCAAFIAFVFFLPINEMLAPAEASDAGPAVGCYAQRIQGLDSRPRAVFRIVRSGNTFVVIGFAINSDGELVAEWRGQIVDLYPGDGMLHWVAQGRIYQRGARIETVENHAFFHVSAIPEDSFIPAGRFVDTSHRNVSEYGFEAMRLSDCPSNPRLMP